MKSLKSFFLVLLVLIMILPLKLFAEGHMGNGGDQRADAAFLALDFSKRLRQMAPEVDKLSKNVAALIPVYAFVQFTKPVFKVVQGSAPPCLHDALPIQYTLDRPLILCAALWSKLSTYQRVQSAVSGFLDEAVTAPTIAGLFDSVEEKDRFVSKWMPILYPRSTTGSSNDRQFGFTAILGTLLKEIYNAREDLENVESRNVKLVPKILLNSEEDIQKLLNRISVHFEDIEDFLAINDGLQVPQGPFHIWVDSRGWQSLSLYTKRAIVLHELLPILGLDDSDLSVSEQYLYWLDEVKR